MKTNADREFYEQKVNKLRAENEKALRQLGEENKALRHERNALALQLEPLKAQREADERLIHAVSSAEPPAWLLDPSGPPRRGPGVPTLFLSDWHWGEMVRPGEVAGRNEYNLAVARERAHRLFASVLDLAFDHMVLPKGWKYPGIVVALGGDMLDMLNGRIHTSEGPNEVAIREALDDLSGVLVRGLGALAERFGRVYVPCVIGNHGRMSARVPARNPAGTSMDAILYDGLARHRGLVGKDVRFDIAKGVDLRYKVYDYAYVLTHGYQWRGGDGEVGALGPVARGVKRLRTKYMQMKLPVDTVILGHFHQYFASPSFIMNGSLKGYDEYAYQGSFEFQPPIQAFWFTHPQRGMTCAWPVYAGERGKKATTDWLRFDALAP
jgi:hypothetical protein